MNASLSLPHRPVLGDHTKLVTQRVPGGAPSRAILVARLRMWRNGLGVAARRRPGRTLLLAGVLLPVLVGLVAAILLASWAAFQRADDATAANALSVMFALIVFGGFVPSASLVLQSLYLATDLPLLHSLPIPPRAIYYAKVAETTLGAGPIGLMLAAVLAGFGVARGVGWQYVAVAAVVEVALLVTVASLAVLVVSVIGRLVPPRRARRFLLLVNLALVVLTWAGWHLVTRGAGGSGAPTRVDGLMHAGGTLAQTPLGWAAQTVVAAAGERPVVALSGGLFAASVVAVVLIAFAVFARTFAVGFARLRAATVPRPHRAAGGWAAAMLGPLPPTLAALVLKEWLTMGRDLRRLSGAVWPLGMVGVYAVTLGRGSGAVAADTPGLAFWLSAGTLLLVPWGASLGIAIYAFGTERRNIHLLRALPIPPQAILVAKVLASLLPILALGEVAVAAMALDQGSGFGQWLGLSGLVAWAAFGYATIDTAAAAVAPNFGALHVQRSTGFLGRALGFAAGTVFTVATALAAGRLVLFAAGVPASLRPFVEGEALGIAPLGWPLVVVAASVAALAVAVPFVVAEARLSRLICGGE